MRLWSPHHYPRELVDLSCSPVNVLGDPGSVHDHCKAALSQPSFSFPLTLGVSNGMKKRHLFVMVRLHQDISFTRLCGPLPITVDISLSRGSMPRPTLGTRVMRSIRKDNLIIRSRSSRGPFLGWPSRSLSRPRIALLSEIKTQPSLRLSYVFRILCYLNPSGYIRFSEVPHLSAFSTIAQIMVMFRCATYSRHEKRPRQRKHLALI
ncbi:hypothetical protein EI94DRAFT_77591 [Lactarius quietus]|nr:hypothetical protein EI94DRAFT_77591 [Lactarius quietus]